MYPKRTDLHHLEEGLLHRPRFPFPRRLRPVGSCRFPRVQVSETNFPLLHAYGGNAARFPVCPLHETTAVSMSRSNRNRSTLPRLLRIFAGLKAGKNPGPAPSRACGTRPRGVRQRGSGLRGRSLARGAGPSGSLLRDPATPVPLASPLDFSGLKALKIPRGSAPRTPRRGGVASLSPSGLP